MPKSRIKEPIGQGDSTKGQYFKASDAQKVGLWKKMIDVKQSLYGHLQAGQFFKKAESWKEVFEFANNEMKMNYQNLKAQRSAFSHQMFMS